MARTNIPSWRRLPIGVELNPDGGAHARVWAPKRKAVEFLVDGGAATTLEAEGNGYFSGAIEQAANGTRYRFRLDDKDAFPDPVSRFQPEGPHGPSVIVDPARFAWTDRDWKGITIDGQVISEIHIGTFTPEGTYRAAIGKLDHLVDVGITCVEIMPLNEFAGKFGWGYDGVNWFAPTRLYGTPDDLRALVDAAHARGLALIIDVVYNHLGPDGNYLAQFSDTVMSQQVTDWGAAINYDGPGSSGVRELAIENAGYWISEFHFDGLRLDATQNIYDTSGRHVLAEITAKARAASGNRSIIIVGENESQDTKLITEYGLDALWNDDFHHNTFVFMTGNNNAYLSGYRGTAQEFLSCTKYGFLYQGQYFAWQEKRRGTPSLRLAPRHLISFLESHDQVANLARSLRRIQLASPGTYRALKALALLSPQTPMLFQGEEFGSTSPFEFFAGHSGDLAAAVQKGRAEFLAQFPGVELTGRRTVPDPCDPRTVERCRLDWAERDRNSESIALHRDLLRLRKEDPVISRQWGTATGELDGAIISPDAFCIRFFSDAHGDRLLVVNLGIRLDFAPAPEPLLAPPAGKAWQTLWSSECVEYGGFASPPLDQPGEGWRIPAQAAVLLAARDVEEGGA